MALSNTVPNLANLATEVKSRAGAGNSAAIQWIESLGSPQEVCKIYDQAVRDLYWADKGAKNLVWVGRAGIDYCLRKAEELESSNVQVASELKAQAKTIAYNVAANSWPGWGDEGVLISASEIEAGLAAAELNLKLAIELRKPDDKVSAAHWLIGAMQLALGQYQKAVTSLDQSIQFGENSSDEAAVEFSRGFKGLALMASGEAAAGTSLFGQSIERLQEIGGDTANGYVAQLETAKGIFVKDRD